MTKRALNIFLSILLRIFRKKKLFELHFSTEIFELFTYLGLVWSCLSLKADPQVQNKLIVTPTGKKMLLFEFIEFHRLLYIDLNLIKTQITLDSRTLSHIFSTE